MQSESKGSAIARSRRRRYDAGFKRELVAKTLAPGASVARIAREHGINANQVFKWRRQQLLAEQPRAGEGALSHKPVTLMPVTVVGDEEPVPAEPGARARVEGLIEITLGGAQVRILGAVDVTTLDHVLSSLRR